MAKPHYFSGDGFNSYVTNYQRVTEIDYPSKWRWFVVLALPLLGLKLSSSLMLRHFSQSDVLLGGIPTWKMWLSVGLWNSQDYMEKHIPNHQPVFSGWWFEPLWKILVNWDEFPIYGKIKKCSKPPTRISFRKFAKHVVDVGRVHPSVACQSWQEL